MGFGIRKPAATDGQAWPAIAIGVFVGLGGVLFGYDTGTTGGILAMNNWQNTFSTGYRDSTGHLNVSPSQSSTIVSILSAGTFFGALTAGPLGDIIGRRWGLILSNLIFIMGVLLQTIATHIPLFVAGRFFAGYGVGLISALIPMYQSETAPKWIRGVIVGCYQLSIAIGLLLAAVINNATQARSDSGSYRIPIGIQMAWSLVLIAGLCFLSETPYYLIKKNDKAGAAISLAKLRRLPSTHPAILEELAEIEAGHTFELSLGSSTYLSCFQGNLRKRMLSGCALQAFSQLSGINFIFYYGVRFFQNSGFEEVFTIILIVTIVAFISTIPGVYAVDAWGRRPVLLSGAIGMCVSQFAVAIIGVTTTGQEQTGKIIVYNLAAQKAAIAFICFFIFFFASACGPSVWVVTGEIFPLKVRSKALSMTTATNWLFNWALAYSTPYLVDYGKGYANLQSKIFFVWGGFCFLYIIFVYFFIYETKGLSLEQVDALFTECHSASASVHWKPTHTFLDREDGRYAHGHNNNEDKESSEPSSNQVL